ARQVRLSLSPREFMVYDSEREAWLVDGGSYRIEAGSSSDKLAVSTEITVTVDPRTLHRIFNRMSPIKYLLEDETGKAALEQAVKGTPAEIWLSGGEIFNSMPVGKLATFGLISEETIEQIIGQVNH